MAGSRFEATFKCASVLVPCLVLLACLGGCGYRPSPVNGQQICGPDAGKTCPTGYTCHARHCFRSYDGGQDGAGGLGGVGGVGGLGGVDGGGDTADADAAPSDGRGDADATVPDGPRDADASPRDGSPATDATCATRSAMVTAVPLDLYLMMDSSGSMLDKTAAGPTKWDAVGTALTAFFNDPQSSGTGVGLQYFPQVRPGVPATCTADGMCGNSGPCNLVRACVGSTTTTVVQCAADGDCPTGQTCELVGSCAVQGGLCAPAGAKCSSGDACTAVAGYCTARDVCDAAVYAVPAVSIGTLPGAAAGLIASLGAHEPDGLTPTGPALSGAIQYARQRVAANPNRKSAVLLVTDGLPTECTPLDIPSVAAVAATGAAGSPAIPTFVIGVFGPTDAATAATNLDALALAGGTHSAVVINTNQNVAQALQTALNQIRTTALPCAYTIPAATVGAIDFGSVNVQLTSGRGAPTTIGHVTGKATCDPTQGGWYYDMAPSTGQAPTSIIACDATCTLLHASTATRLDIVFGCQTP